MPDVINRSQLPLLYSGDELKRYTAVFLLVCLARSKKRLLSETARVFARKRNVQTSSSKCYSGQKKAESLSFTKNCLCHHKLHPFPSSIFLQILAFWWQARVRYLSHPSSLYAFISDLKSLVATNKSPHHQLSKGKDTATAETEWHQQ